MSSGCFSYTPQKVPLVDTKYRKIQTSIPHPDSSKLWDELTEIESRSMHGQLPIIWDKAKDFQVYDSAGNCWIDFTSTIFVTNVGHANTHLVESLRGHLDKNLLHTYNYVNRPRIDYLKKLMAMSPPYLDKAFLMSAGTESTEAATKIMRLAGQSQGKKKLGIISLTGNWHGRTMGAQLLSTHSGQKGWIPCDSLENYYLSFPYEWDLKGQSGADFFKESLKNLTDSGINPQTDICGFILETFQGWGAIFYPKDYVQAVSKFCKDNKILLAFDEMQAGFARTGKLFGFEHYEVKPDLICVGKGMASGLPLSGVIGKKEYMDLPEVGDMSSTHSANPLVCIAGLATLEEIESRKLIDRSRDLGNLLHEKLEEMKSEFSERISYVYGKGLLAAIHFKDPKTGKPESSLPSKVSEKCMHKGLLVVHTGRESIKLAPPLTIDEEALLEGLTVLREAIVECLK